MFQALSAFDLTKTYRTRAKQQVPALRGLNLQVRDGETYGFLGPNGAGKTTTIRLFLGLLKPDSGRMLVLGKEHPTADLRRKIGYVPENPAFPEFLTVFSILNLRAALLGLPNNARADAVEQVMVEVGIQQQSGQVFRELSRGQRQRVAMAVALLGSPQLLILDEPTSGFDALARTWFKRFLDRIKTRGITVFFCSHLLGDVEELCQRVGIIHAGRMVMEGTLPEVLNRASHIEQAPVKNLEAAFTALIKEERGGEDLDRGVGYGV